MNPLFNQSLEKGLSVLSIFTAKHRSMTIAEVGKYCEMNKSSAQRMVYTLEQLGFLEKHPKTRRYQLTVKALSLGFNYLSTNPLIDVANPFLSELTNITQETVCLTEPYNNEMVYIARFISAKFVPVHMPIGSRIPMYCTSAGRAYLSALEESDQTKILNSSPLEQHTAHTETNINKIQNMLAEAKQLGYAINKEELFLGDMALGSPIINSQGHPIAAVHIVAPNSRWTISEAKEKLAPSLIACARSLSNAVRAIN